MRMVQGGELVLAHWSRRPEQQPCVPLACACCHSINQVQLRLFTILPSSAATYASIALMTMPQASPVLMTLSLQNAASASVCYLDVASTSTSGLPSANIRP